MNAFELSLADLPRWHELSFEDDPAPALAVRTHPGVRDALTRELSGSGSRKEIERCLRTFCFGGWAPPSETETWGFPQQAQDRSGRPAVLDARGWTVWKFPLPRTGLGARSPVGQQDAYASAATLSLFLSALDGGVRSCESRELGPALQLMRVSTRIDDRASFGAPMSAMLPPEALRRVRTALAPATLADISEAMRRAFEWLWGGPFERLYGDFVAECLPPHDPQLILPLGNAAGVFPSHVGRLPEGGLVLQSHNLDTPLHQLTILCGLARAHAHLSALD